MVGCYYGSLLYATTVKNGAIKTYGKCAVHVNTETARKWADKLPENLLYKNGTDRKVWIVPARFQPFGKLTTLGFRWNTPLWQEKFEETKGEERIVFVKYVPVRAWSV